MLTVIVALLAVGSYAGYTAYQHFVTRVLTVPGCQAGSGNAAIALDFEQAADAATIAGVAVADGLPKRALAIAYATALQESKLANVDYGTADSVGIFQQRPSQGWGTAEELQDPVFASRAFFRALVKIPGYESKPVYEAAQDVQRSADGSAYAQWEQSGTLLASYFTTVPHSVTCWYDPASQAASEGVSTKLNLNQAAKELKRTFGANGGGGAVRRVTLAESGKTGSFKVSKAGGWPAANWLVAHASSYGITHVTYGGYRWTASLTETSWQRVSGNPAGSIVAG